MTCLVAIAPEEVLGTDVLVGVFGLLLHGGIVLLVFPVRVPPHLSVDASKDQAGNSHAKELSVGGTNGRFRGEGRTKR